MRNATNLLLLGPIAALMLWLPVAAHPQAAIAQYFDEDYGDYYWGRYYEDDVYAGYGWRHWDEPLEAGEGETGRYGVVDDYQTEASPEDVFDYTRHPYIYDEIWWTGNWALDDDYSWMEY